MRQTITPKFLAPFSATLIVGLWFTTLGYALQTPLHPIAVKTVLLIWAITHLFTGLFITAHDAMHGTASSNRTLNEWIGRLTVILYATFSYKKLYTNHHLHHQHVHTNGDPDYHQGNFFAWYFSFMKHYVSLLQIVFMAIIFNLLSFIFPQENVVYFWLIPALLSTLQLFFFGTYLPHKGEHANVHHSRSFMNNHLLAFVTCYFFGYHYEHHDSPGTPWWLLWKKKKLND